MQKGLLKYTGNPFLDASIGAILAVTDKNSPEDLKQEDLEEAVERLKAILLSPQALGKGVSKSFTRGALSQIFPNSPLVNPSSKDPATKYSDLLEDTLEKVKNFRPGSKSCPICGKKYAEGVNQVKADKFPLLRGLANFYPFLSDGMEICPNCFLVIQFFPMVVLKGAGYLWFFHTQNTKLSKVISKKFGWSHLETLVAGNTSLEFFGGWNSIGEAGTILELFYKMFKDFAEYEQDLFESKHPIIVYLFTNDNRTAFVRHIVIPHKVLEFLGFLYYEDKRAFERFFRELLFVPTNLKGKVLKIRKALVARAAQTILEKRPLLSQALEDNPPYVRGGWKAHRLYLREVRNMPVSKLKILEDLGRKVFAFENQKKWTTGLKTASYPELSNIFLQFVKEGWLTSHEFYFLAPPGEDFFLFEARDILLAVIYESDYLAREGLEFPEMSEGESLSPDKYYQKIESMSQNIVKKYPNPARFLGDLKNMRKPHGIRGVYLKVMEHGAIRWSDFIFLVPIEDTNRLYLNRDYLIACLTEKLSLEGGN